HVRTKNSLHCLLAKTRSIYQNLTLVARTHVANPLTPVTATTKNLITALTTSKNRLTIRASCRNCFLSTRTYTRRGKCLTRRARTRVALQHTNMRAKILLTPSRTNDIPLKWLPTRFPTRMGCQIQVRRRVGSLTTEADISNLL
ncbi:hypothetical protein TorRG33x02_284210, partial [Trema orientale]